MATAHSSSLKEEQQCRNGGSGWVVPATAMLVATAVTAQAAYRARHAPWDLAFVLFAYADLGLLFLCLTMYERLPPPLEEVQEGDSGDDGAAVSRRRRRSLKMAVWALSTALSAAFAWRLVAVMPAPAPALKAAVWAMTASVVVGVLYFLVVNDGRATPADSPVAGEPHANAIVVHLQGWCRASCSCLHLAAVAFLASAFVEMSRPALPEPWDLAFVAAAYANLAALFVVLRRAERLTPASPAKERRRLLRQAWELLTALSCAFAYCVEKTMPAAMAVFVWAMTASVVVGGVYFLVLKDGRGSGDCDRE